MPRPLPLLEALDEVGAGVEAAPHVLVLLDFDGTLAPIVDRPELARLPDRTRTVVERLARRANCTVGLVSGRTLGDLRERVGIGGVVYAGNHGLEIAGGGLCYEAAAALALGEEISGAVATLSARLGQILGVLVEAKGLTASVHYRLVSPTDRTEVERVVRETVAENHPTLRVVGGKMVWEVRPRVPWNKGSAVRWIREQLGLREALTVYLGDDQTDEDAFAEIGPFVTARVGAAPSTRAGYHVADPEEVAEFLVWLSRLVQFADRPSPSASPAEGSSYGSRPATSECEG